jgi:sorbitol-specific phosphotransferase system component IIBC
MKLSPFFVHTLEFYSGALGFYFGLQLTKGMDVLFSVTFVMIIFLIALTNNLCAYLLAYFLPRRAFFEIVVTLFLMAISYLVILILAIAFLSPFWGTLAMLIETMTVVVCYQYAKGTIDSQPVDYSGKFF